MAPYCIETSNPSSRAAVVHQALLLLFEYISSSCNKLCLSQSLHWISAQWLFAWTSRILSDEWRDTSKMWFSGVHLWNKAVSAISRFFQSEDENTCSLVWSLFILLVGILTGFKGLRVRKVIQHVFKHAGKSDKRENSRFHFPDSSGQLYWTELFTRLAHGEVVAYYSQHRGKGVCCFVWVIHSQYRVCTVWSSCLLSRLIRGFCMRDCVNSGSSSETPVSTGMMLGVRFRQQNIQR